MNTLYSGGECSGKNLCFYERAFEFKFRDVFGSREQVSSTHFSFFLTKRERERERLYFLSQTFLVLQ